ncbi:hypothetical protein [Vibrio sp. NTOU-M3]|uniref:hypothetical protein n=1 Tax=unclassified Vibrio TaxID=2614977 RepID=UPI00349F7EA0
MKTKLTSNIVILSALISFNSFASTSEIKGANIVQSSNHLIGYYDGEVISNFDKNGNFREFYWESSEGDIIKNKSFIAQNSLPTTYKFCVAEDDSFNCDTYTQSNFIRSARSSRFTVDLNIALIEAYPDTISYIHSIIDMRVVTGYSNEMIHEVFSDKGALVSSQNVSFFTNAAEDEIFIDYDRIPETDAYGNLIDGIYSCATVLFADGSNVEKCTETKKLSRSEETFGEVWGINDRKETAFSIFRNDTSKGTHFYSLAGYKVDGRYNRFPGEYNNQYWIYLGKSSSDAIEKNNTIKDHKAWGDPELNPKVGDLFVKPLYKKNSYSIYKLKKLNFDNKTHIKYYEFPKGNYSDKNWEFVNTVEWK